MIVLNNWSMRFYRRLLHIPVKHFKNIYGLELHNCHHRSGRIYSDFIEEADITEGTELNFTPYGKFYSFRFKVE